MSAEKGDEIMNENLRRISRSSKQAKKLRGRKKTRCRT